MAIGDYTIGVKGSGASDFATLPIPPITINQFPAGVPPVRGQLNYAALSDRSLYGTPQITGTVYGEKEIWTIPALITQSTARQLGALAKWYDRYIKGPPKQLAFTLGAGNSNGNGTLVASAAISTETPNVGRIRATRDDGSVDVLTYNSFTGSAFTLSGMLPATYSAGNTANIDSGLRLIDEIDHVDSEPTPHSRTLLTPISESWNSNYTYGYGVFDAILQLSQDWRQLTGVWSDGEGARTLTFSILEL